jgi:hypothetical protein
MFRFRNEMQLPKAVTHDNSYQKTDLKIQNLLPRLHKFYVPFAYQMLDFVSLFDCVFRAISPFGFGIQLGSRCEPKTGVRPFSRKNCWVNALANYMRQDCM